MNTDVVRASGRRRLRWWQVTAVAALVLAVALPAGVSLAIDEKPITACVHNTTGDVRIVAPDTACDRFEHGIEWNRVGPQGKAGPAGPQGAEGPAGAAAPLAEPADEPVTLTTSGDLECTGAQQGPIRGEQTRRGSEGAIEVLGYAHSVNSAHDPATGLPTGKRQHKPFSFIVASDAASVALRNAMTTNEVLDCTMTLYRLAGGDEVELRPFVTFQLTDAHVVGMGTHAGLDASQTAPAPDVIEEQVSFTYKKIKFSNVGGGFESIDTWDN